MESTKHIICTVTNDLNYDQRMQRICSTLVEAGYAVTLVGRKRQHSKPLSKQIFKQHRLNCRIERGMLFYAEYNIRLFFYLLKARYNAVCSIDFDSLLAGTLATLLRRKKRVFDAHEYYTETPELVSRPYVQSVWSVIGRFCLYFYKYGYTVGPSLAALFSNQYGFDFQVVKNVPLKRTTPKPTKVQSPKIILYQGALNEGRGLEAAIRAMLHVPTEIELHLAGEGDLSDALRDMVTVKGLKNRVKFLGFVRPTELKKLTDSAWLGLNLLENRGLSYYYSLANKFFDYMQADVPSLNMDFPEYREIIDNFPCALLLEDLNPRAIAKIITQLEEESEVYNKLKLACRTAAKEFIWEKEKEALLKVWKQVFEQPS